LNALRIAHKKELQKLKDENENQKFKIKNLEQELNDLKNDHRASLKDLNDRIKD